MDFFFFLAINRQFDSYISLFIYLFTWCLAWETILNIKLNDSITVLFISAKIMKVILKNTVDL